MSPARRRLEVEHWRSGETTTTTVMQLFTSPESSAGVEELLARFFKSDPAHALAHLSIVANFKDVQTAERCKRRICREWLRLDPQTALTDFTAGGRGERKLSRYEGSLRRSLLIEEWSRLDPAAAAAALPSLPEGGPGFERKDFARTVFRSWKEIDPVAARTWAATEAKPEWRDALQ